MIIYDVVPQRTERLLEDLKPVEENSVSETWLAQRLFQLKQASDIAMKAGVDLGSEHCVICLAGFDEDSWVLFLECFHIFHEKCGL